MKRWNVGAVWIHEHTDEQTGNVHCYLTGYIDCGIFGRFKISLHTNQHKTEDKHPDYIISRYEEEAV